MSANPSARKLRHALAASLALALLAPAAAGARLGAADLGCQLELQAGARRVIAGESATLTGSLSCPATVSAAEQTVTLNGHVAGTPGASPLGTVTTEADGAFHLSTEALDADSNFYATVPGARSERVWVRVAPLVTIAGPAAGTELTAGGGRVAANAQASSAGANTTSSTVTFTGTVSPEEAGPRVVLERESANDPERWIVLGSAPVGAGGGYAITHTFGIAGTATVRVVLRARRNHLAGVSATLSYQIVRAAVAGHAGRADALRRARSH
ncbi:MAG TPA: hypothetical protein VGY13_07330 [Solirubrobacteraceae bacterium]|jgi:hypothetical protein|nr:hypothetical protein [Solirubrobacteraceae bacterium]